MIKITTTHLKRFKLALSISMGLAIMPMDSFGVAVTTQHNNNARTGHNNQETILNTSNVNVSSFGKLYSYNISKLFNKSWAMQWNGQALYVPNVYISKLKKTYNVLYACTNNGSGCFAVDADSNTGLWQTTPWVASSPGSVLSTPVIDTSSNTLYVVDQNSLPAYRLHAIDITTGAEKPSSPVIIQGQVLGSGSGSTNGILAFVPLWQFQRPGLLLLNGNIYIGFGGASDLSTAHGWVFSYSAKTLQFNSVISTSPNVNLTSIWQAGNGLAADNNGFIYVHTGNNMCRYVGFKCAVVGDYSNSVLKIDTSNNGLNIVDYFTPSNQSQLNIGDADMSSSVLC